MYISSSLSVLATPVLIHALVLKDGVTGRLPALGWNSWNIFGCDVSEPKVLTAATHMVSLGFQDAGYEYVNIDDCWSRKSGRDKTTNKLVPDPVNFPDGIKGVADQIHAKGLKVGIYSSAGTKTCDGYPASIDLETLDASTFASWGIDYLKYDNCNVPSKWADKYDFCVPDTWGSGTPYKNGTCAKTSRTAPVGYDWSTSNSAKRYGQMRDAILAQDRVMLYSLCQWGNADVERWGNATGNSWRMSGDITAKWSRIIEILNYNSFELNSVNFWGHNDADMLEVGNGKLTLAECRSHFAFWAAMKSPLILGTTLQTLTNDQIDILQNKYLLAFNQDPVVGEPATPYRWGTNPNWSFNQSYPAEYWSGISSNGTLVLNLNPLTKSASRSILWSEVPQLPTSSDSFLVTEVWTGESLGCVKNGVTKMLEGHDTMAYLVGSGCSTSV